MVTIAVDSCSIEIVIFSKLGLFDRCLIIHKIFKVASNDIVEILDIVVPQFFFFINFVASCDYFLMHKLCIGLSVIYKVFNVIVNADHVQEIISFPCWL